MTTQRSNTPVKGEHNKSAKASKASKKKSGGDAGPPLTSDQISKINGEIEGLQKIQKIIREQIKDLKSQLPAGNSSIEILGGKAKKK